MSKIEINATIENNDQKEKINTQAIITDNIIKYKEKDNTTVIYDYINNTLRRENDSINMHYRFSLKEETEGLLNIKELQRNIYVKIKTDNIKRKENDIEIKYQIEDDKFLYQIEEIK